MLGCRGTPGGLKNIHVLESLEELARLAVPTMECTDRAYDGGGEERELVKDGIHGASQVPLVVAELAGEYSGGAVAPRIDDPIPMPCHAMPTYCYSVTAEEWPSTNALCY